MFFHEGNSRNGKKTFSWTFLVFTLHKQVVGQGNSFFEFVFLSILKVKGPNFLKMF